MKILRDSILFVFQNNKPNWTYLIELLKNQLKQYEGKKSNQFFKWYHEEIIPTLDKDILQNEENETIITYSILLCRYLLESDYFKKHSTNNREQQSSDYSHWFCKYFKLSDNSVPVKIQKRFYLVLLKYLENDHFYFLEVQITSAYPKVNAKSLQTIMQKYYNKAEEKLLKKGILIKDNKSINPFFFSSENMDEKIKSILKLFKKQNNIPQVPSQKYLSIP